MTDRTYTYRYTIDEISESGIIESRYPPDQSSLVVSEELMPRIGLEEHTLWCDMYGSGVMDESRLRVPPSGGCRSYVLRLFHSDPESGWCELSTHTLTFVPPAIFTKEQLGQLGIDVDVEGNTGDCKFCN